MVELLFWRKLDLINALLIWFLFIIYFCLFIYLFSKETKALLRSLPPPTRFLKKMYPASEASSSLILTLGQTITEALNPVCILYICVLFIRNSLSAGVSCLHKWRSVLAEKKKKKKKKEVDCGNTSNNIPFVSRNLNIWLRGITIFGGAWCVGLCAAHVARCLRRMSAAYHSSSKGTRSAPSEAATPVWIVHEVSTASG